MREIKITLKIQSYNDRRFGRPWIAKIEAWAIGGHPVLKWGSFIGDSHGGFLEIAAYPGDVVRDGQKDHRGNCGWSDWSVVQEDGTLRKVTPIEARQAFDRKLELAQTPEFPAK